jgi:hypothetical protein
VAGGFLFRLVDQWMGAAINLQFVAAMWRRGCALYSIFNWQLLVGAIIDGPFFTASFALQSGISVRFALMGHSGSPFTF